MRTRFATDLRWDGDEEYFWAETNQRIIIRDWHGSNPNQNPGEIYGGVKFEDNQFKNLDLYANTTTGRICRRL